MLTKAGSIDILDVIVLNKAIFEKKNFLNKGPKCADVDRDGLPSSADALMIMKHIVGLINLNA